MRIQRMACVVTIVLCFAVSVLAQSKPKLTLDDFFNAVSFRGVELSPDGNAVVFSTDRADWDQQIFRTDLWLYQDDGKGGSLIQLTQSGHDSDPKWSPDGKWIAISRQDGPRAFLGGFGIYIVSRDGSYRSLGLATSSSPLGLGAPIAWQPIPKGQTRRSR